MTAKQVYIIEFGASIEVFSSLKKALEFIRSLNGVKYSGVAIGAINDVELEAEINKDRYLYFNAGDIRLFKRGLR